MPSFPPSLPIGQLQSQLLKEGENASSGMPARQLVGSLLILFTAWSALKDLNRARGSLVTGTGDRNSCENREGSQCCVVSSLCREIAKGRGLKSRGGRAGRIVNLNRKKCGGMARARGSAHGRNRNIRQVPRWRSRSAAERRNSKGIQTQFGDRAPLLQDAPSAGPS